MAKSTAVFYRQPRGEEPCAAVRNRLSESSVARERHETWSAPITLTVGDFIIKLNAQQLQDLLETVSDEEAGF